MLCSYTTQRQERQNSRPRAYTAHFVGYLFTSTLFQNFNVLEVYPNGKYGTVRNSKDVIFDESINFLNPDPNKFPEDNDFHPVDLEDLDSSSPKTLIPPLIPPPEPPPVKSHVIGSNNHKNDATASERFPEEADAVYWFSMLAETDTHEMAYTMAEISHWKLSVAVKEPNVPKSFWEAMRYPEWEAAINKESGKFEVNNCLQEVPYTNQHLVPMMWLFNVKTDGTKKARLVGRGDLIIP